MSIDAVALLGIPKLVAPRSALGAEYLVQHRGKASLLHTFNRFHGAAPDEHALALRQLLGPALDAHDDSRGILVFPDVCEPKGKSYEAIVRELEGAGVWAPKVDLDHAPARYTDAATDSHEGLVAKMLKKLGRNQATQLDMMAQVHLLLIDSTNGRADAVKDYQATLTKITAALGDEFARSYERSLRSKLDADRAAQTAHFERAQRLHARAEAGVPLVSHEELSALLTGGGKKKKR
jgi:hypothetical protein